MIFLGELVAVVTTALAQEGSFPSYMAKPNRVVRMRKICVYAIAKNEEQFVERFCNSVKDADLVLIADTGSTDRTVELAKECGATVHEIYITPWRFDKARDAALALVPREYEICVSIDLDEVAEPGWYEEIQRVWKDNTTRLRYKYDWGGDISFYYEKIHSRHGYHWHHPCHEYPRCDGRVKEIYAQTDKLLVSHLPDQTKSRRQYLALLELSVKEDPSCPRNAFYYARELTFDNRWHEAVDALHNYLKNPLATWPNERCYALRLLGKANIILGNPEQAQDWLKQASEVAPNTREPWVDLADLAWRRNKWELAYDCAKNALDIKDKSFVYTMDPAVWGAKPHDILALSAYHLGKRDEAIEHGKIACDLDPSDKRLKTNLEFYSVDTTA